MAKSLPLSQIDCVDNTVKLVVKNLTRAGRQQEVLMRLSADEKAQVAKHTAENGVLSTVQHFSRINQSDLQKN